VSELAWQARYELKPEQQPLHNVDISTLKALPKREPGWSIQKPESHGLPEAKTPDGGAPGEGGDPIAKTPENLASPYQELYEHLKRNPRSVVIGGRGWGHERFERLKNIDKS
jgi:hypothetical protein